MNRGSDGIHVTLIEGTPRAAVDGLVALLGAHGESVEIRVEPVRLPDDEDWLLPARIQIDTYWQSRFFDGILGNLQEDTADEDIWAALTEALRRVWRSPSVWIGPYDTVANPLFRLRAFLEAHRTVQFTIPAEVRVEALQLAVEELGNAVAHSTNLESELSHDGMLAGVFNIDLVFDPDDEVWWAILPDELVSHDEEDSELEY